METRLIALLVACILARSVACAQVTTPKYELRGFIGLLVAEPNPGADFRIIRAVDSESPAGRAGVTRGDYILSVDGRPTTTLKTKDELINLLRGDPGTTVRLELRRAGSCKVEFMVITRVAELLPSDPSR